MKHYFLGISLIILIGYSCNPYTVRLDRFILHGIDVSHYQAEIDWKKVKEQGVYFAFVKASEGRSLHDPRYCTNWDALKEQRIKRGAYHFFRPTIPAEVQVQNFSDIVEMEYGDLPPVLDVEVLDGVSKVELINGVREWIYTIEIKYGVKPIIYTNLKFYNKYLAGHFPEYPLWIARYNTKEPTLACGRDWHFWQYGNKGKIEGISGEVDFNVFHGTTYELEALCLAPKPIISGY